ncbi:MAG: TlpA family protein disulfide reductase [Dysgonamonadaceae bacterium]|jgi:thiol-disulfide isomerase/thioredoxin|nr:TlpA family protein disulfide reductase [Dysgonamonadaceae bacterium]
MKRIIWLLTAFYCAANLFGQEVVKSDSPAGRQHVPERFLRPKTDRTPLKAPVLKEGEAVLKGIVLGYRPDVYSDESLIYVNNAFLSWQETKDFLIQNDGTFSVKISLPYTMEVGLQLCDGALYNSTMMLSPGETTEICIDASDEIPHIYYCGANAAYNEQFANIVYNYIKQNINHTQIMKDIAGMSLAQYKDYNLLRMETVLAGVDSLAVSEKTKELTRLNIQFEFLHLLSMAEFNMEDAYKEANNIPYDVAAPDYQAPVFTPEYYDFLKTMPVNDAKALYCSSYFFAVNSCRYISSSLREAHNSSANDNITEMLNRGMIDKEDVETAKKIMEMQPENWPEERIEVRKKEFEAYINFIIKDRNLSPKGKSILLQINDLLIKDNPFKSDYMVLSFELISDIFKNNEVTQEDLDSLNNNSFFAKDDDYFVGDDIADFNTKYVSEMQFVAENARLKNSLDCVAGYLGTDKGILFDCIKLQALSGSLDEYTPLSDLQLAEIGKMGNPFYLKYFKKKNADLIAKISNSRKKSDFKVYETPNVDNEQLFSEIIKPFAGKPILIDFWATWCVPCRNAHKMFREKKEEYLKKGVVFVYLTDESSPLATWQNMISEISGEHYRLSAAQFKYLREKFGVEGVPSYLIISPEGKQVYFGVGFNQGAIESTLTSLTQNTSSPLSVIPAFSK